MVQSVGSLRGWPAKKKTRKKELIPFPIGWIRHRMRFPNDCRVFFFLSLLLFLLLLLFISTSSTVVREIHSEPIDFVRGSFRSVMDFFFFSFLFFFEGGGGGISLAGSHPMPRISLSAPSVRETRNKRRTTSQRAKRDQSRFTKFYSRRFLW